jgi:hypothetical protein
MPGSATVGNPTTADPAVTARFEVAAAARAPDPASLARGEQAPAGEGGEEVKPPDAGAPVVEGPAAAAPAPVSELATRWLAPGVSALEQGLDRFLAGLHEAGGRLEQLLGQPSWGWWYAGGAAALGAAALALYGLSRRSRDEEALARELCWALGLAEVSWPRREVS